MVEIPTPHYLKPGHRFDSGPIILDLYRLLSLVLAEKQVSVLIKAEFDGFAWLRERYLESEIVRILISAATSIRISFDQTDPLMFENLTTNCGTLHWPKQDKTEVLDLREACNKIIHATRINFDGRLDPMDHPSNPEPDPLYLIRSSICMVSSTTATGMQNSRSQTLCVGPSLPSGSEGTGLKQATHGNVVAL